MFFQHVLLIPESFKEHSAPLCQCPHRPYPIAFFVLLGMSRMRRSSCVLPEVLLGLGLSSTLPINLSLYNHLVIWSELFRGGSPISGSTHSWVVQSSSDCQFENLKSDHPGRRAWRHSKFERGKSVLRRDDSKKRVFQRPFGSKASNKNGQSHGEKYWRITSWCLKNGSWNWNSSKILDTNEMEKIIAKRFATQWTPVEISSNDF